MKWWSSFIFFVSWINQSSVILIVFSLLEKSSACAPLFSQPVANFVYLLDVGQIAHAENKLLQLERMLMVGWGVSAKQKKVVAAKLRETAKYISLQVHSYMQLVAYVL